MSVDIGIHYERSGRGRHHFVNFSDWYSRYSNLDTCMTIWNFYILVVTGYPLQVYYTLETSCMYILVVTGYPLQVHYTLETSCTYILVVTGYPPASSLHSWNFLHVYSSCHRISPCKFTTLLKLLARIF